MIENFEDQTQRLSDSEKQMLPALVNLLQDRIGKQNSIKNYALCKVLNETYNFSNKFNDARIRKMINYIRNKGLVPRLMATSDGYYVTTDSVELESFIRSLNGRIAAITKVRDSMVEQLKTFKKYEQITTSN